jgi:hypothetical protein
MTPKFKSKTKGKCNRNGNRRFLHCAVSLREPALVEMTPKFQKTNQVQGQVQPQRQGQPQVPPLRIRASANVPVGMTPKFKSKTKGKCNRNGNRRFLHCTFAQARTFRSE